MRESMYEEIQQLMDTKEKRMYLVRHVLTHVFYIKKIFPQHCDHSLYEELKAQTHVGMANIIESELTDNGFIILEEFINGTTLEYEMSARKIPVNEIQDIFMELFDVLDHLHRLVPPIIHRDIKPGNIMLERGHVRLIDFEIARSFIDGKNRDTQIFGSVGFAAPEQYGFRQSDQRSDIYSLGVLLKELLQDSEGLSPYKRMIDRCLEMEPSKRYQNIGELKKQFMKCSCMKYTNEHRHSHVIDIPGFRNETYLQKGFIFVFYAFSLYLGFTIKTTEPSTAPDLFFQKLAFTGIILLLLWIPSNVGHCLEVLPFYHSKYKIVRMINGILIWLLASIIFMFAMVLLSGIVDSLI